MIVLNTDAMTMSTTWFERTNYVSTMPSDEDAGDARTRLLDAAIHIASTQGLDKVTYRSVSARAGLAHSLVRFYFGSGEAMVTEALIRASQIDSQESHLNAGSIDEFGKDFVQVMLQDLERGMLLYDSVLRGMRKGLALDQAISVYDHYTREVAVTLKNIGVEDPDGSTAALVMTIFDGLVLQHAIYRSEDRTERILEKLRDVLRMLHRES